MSQNLSSLPQRKYGATDDAATELLMFGGSQEAPSHDRSGVWPPNNSPPSVGGEQQQHRLKRRRRNLVAAGAFIIGLAAAVVGLEYSKQPSNVGASLVDVVVPAAETSQSEKVRVVHRSFPKPTTAIPPRPAESVSRTPTTEENLVRPLSFEALNFYHARDGKPGLDYPWLRDVKLIEPHRETTLSVSSPRDGYEYIWEVRGGDADEADLHTTASGAEAVVILTILDDNVIRLKEVNSEGTVVRRLDEMVMVKYVRREIRTLTDEEREELLDAMFTLWEVKVDGGNGKERYGDNYADIYAMNRLHIMAAMNKTCDHFHDGLGFLIGHSMISNTFEYSLQLVNPKLTLPYWDFTIDGVEAQTSSVDGEVVVSPPLFQESWFGTADPADNVVKDGRWAYTVIPALYDSNPGNIIPDVYDRLRSRWNVALSPYLLRGLGKMCYGHMTDSAATSGSWAWCDTHHSLVKDNPDWYSFGMTVLGDPHGPVHSWIGGMLNCEDTLGRLNTLVGKEATDALGVYALAQRKKFWRNGFFECEGSVETDGVSEIEVFSSGRCGCLGYDLKQGDDWQKIYYNSTMEFDDIMGEHDDDTKRLVVEAVCESTIYFGDHIHAGSAMDPTFWPLYPTLERLFMFSVLTGRTTDMSWPDRGAFSPKGELNIYGEACDGHGGSDVFPFGLLDTDTDGFEIKTGIKGNVEVGNVLTNREILAALDPTGNKLSYVYDTFKWDHCLEVGIDFEDAWDTITQGRRA
ncbi:unnamed protein product [Pylaiella littoralis]